MRWNVLLPALLISVTALLLWRGLTNGHDWGDDFAAYIMQAKSLTEGSPSEFIEANRVTIERSSRHLGPVTYPWGFPVLLAPFYALFGLNMLALKSVGVVCFLGFLCLLQSGFRKYHADGWRMVLLGLFALNPTMLGFVDVIHSDIPFLLVSTASVLLIGRVVVERRRLISPACDQLLLGAAIAVAFFIRTNGILLLVTLGITQVIARMGRVDGPAASPEHGSAGCRRLVSTPGAAVRRVRLNVLPYGAFVSCVAAWQALLPDGGLSQGFIMGEVSLGVMKRYLSHYIDVLAEFFTGVPHHRLLYGASIPLAIAGAVRRSRSDYHAIVYVILTLLLYTLWPRFQGLRFLLPILPFYLSFLLSGLESYQASTVEPGRIVRKVLCILPIVLILLYLGQQSVSNAFGNLARNRASSSGPFVETSRSMFAYLETHVEPPSTVVFFKPRALRMMTGRRSVLIDNVGGLSRGDYVCLYRGHEADRYQISPDDVRLLATQGSLREVYRNRDFVVYQLPTSPREALHTDGGGAVPHAHR